MPPPRMDMRMIKDVLRLKLHGGLSHEAICRSLSISKGVVSKYVSRAAAGGLDWATVAGLSEAELERRLLGRSANDARIASPDFARVHVELRRKGVTLTLLWQEYRAAHEGERTWGLSQFCERYKLYAKTLLRSHRAGEKLFVDFAGPPWHWPTAGADRCQRRGDGGLELHVRLRDAGPDHAILAGRNPEDAAVSGWRAAVDRAGQPARADREPRPVRAARQRHGAGLLPAL